MENYELNAIQKFDKKDDKGHDIFGSIIYLH